MKASTKQLNARIPAEVYSMAKEVASKYGSIASLVEKGIRLASAVPIIKLDKEPRSLLEFIILAKLSEVLEREEDRASGLIYVTDLTYCPEKYRILSKNPSIALISPVQGSTLTGSLAHLGLALIIVNSLPDAEVERRIEYTFEDGKKLVGRADVIYRGEVYEIKFVSAVVENRVHPHYALQAWIYKILTGAKKAHVFYIVKKGELIEVEVKKDDVLRAIRETGLQISEEDIEDEKFLEMWYEFWKGNRAPTPLWGPWECNYCNIQQFCMKKQKVNGGKRNSS